MTVSAIARAHTRPSSSAPASPRVRTEVAAGLSLVAAGMHLWVLDAHLQEWWAYGVFFLACAVGQAGLGVVLLSRTPPWLVLTGIAGNLAVVGMYVLSRTNGPPLGPHAGRPEPAQLLDVSCTIAELGVIVALLGLLPAALARRTATFLALIGLALWTARLSGVLL
jgi:hypothetical protein